MADAGHAAIAPSLRHVGDSAEQIRHCRSPNALDGRLAQLAQTAGVAGLVFQQLWTAEGTWTGRYSLGGGGAHLRNVLDEASSVSDPLNLLLTQQDSSVLWGPQAPLPFLTASRLIAAAAQDNSPFGHSIAVGDSDALGVFHAFSRTPLGPDTDGFWRDVAALVHRTALPVLAGARRRRDGRSVRPVLTRREREAVQHMVAGRTSGEIASAMRPQVSARTVDEYLAASMRKLDVASRSQLSARAVALRVVVPA